MSVLQLSTGSTLNANILTATARSIVRNLDGNVAVAGVTGFDTVKLVSAARDTAYQNATAQAPIPLGPEGDDITFKPLVYPEISGE